MYRTRLSFALLLAIGLAAGGCSRKEDAVAESPAPAGEPPAALAETTAAMPSGGVAYVSNQDGGVTVIDLASMEVQRQLEIGGKGPRGLGITDDGRTLVTANKDDGNISLIDTGSGKLLGQVAIGKNPEFVRIKGDMAFVSYEPSSKGGPPPKPGAAVDDDDEEGTVEEPARVAVVDLKSRRMVNEIVSGPETEGIEFTPDGSKLVVTNEADNTITVHYLGNGKLYRTIPTKAYGDRPRGIKVSPDGSTYVATLEYGNKFLVLDADFNPVRTVDTGKSPYGIAFDREGKLIYVAAAKEQKLQVFDAKTFQKVREVQTGERCWHFTFTPDDKNILLACGRSNEVLLIDKEKFEVTKRIGDKQLPWGVVAYPKSAGSLDKP